MILVAAISLSALPAAAVPVPERWGPEGPVEPIWERVAFQSDVLPDFEGPIVEHLEECIGGMAGGWACDRVDPYELLTLSAMGGSAGNDIWGWTDPVTGTEYALMGMNNGTAFVDLSAPTPTTPARRSASTPTRTP